MDRKRLKFVALGTAVFGIMTLLVVYGMVTQPGGLVYYMTLAEFLEQAEPAAGDSRINGTVRVGSIERTATGQDVSFEMTDGERTLPVYYRGIIPDTFVDDAAVVVEGALGADGTFVAHTLLAKCPSKYEAADDYVDASG